MCSGIKLSVNKGKKAIMDQEKNNANGKSRRPIVYIKRTIILVLLFSLVYFMYTKIVAHNKKEETLKAAAELKKQEELKKKEEKKEARSTKTKRAGRTSKASTSCRTAC